MSCNRQRGIWGINRWILLLFDGRKVTQEGLAGQTSAGVRARNAAHFVQNPWLHFQINGPKAEGGLMETGGIDKYCYL